MRAHAVLLDVTHHLQLIGDAIPVIEVPAGVRPLAALEAAAPALIGRPLPFPLGQQVDGDDAWFVFVESIQDAARVPLRRWAGEHARAWQLYREVMLGGWEPPTTALDVFYFGNEPRFASQLAHHVIKGRKRATTGWVAITQHDGWQPPAPGTVSVVTDGFGVPLCAIETTRVEHGAFRDATAEIAEAEAEGDGSLADWRDGHRAYFEAEARRIGVAFSDDAELCYEHFRVLRVFQRAA